MVEIDLDIFTEILQHVDSCADISRLSRTCRNVRPIAVEKLLRGGVQLRKMRLLGSFRAFLEGDEDVRPHLVLDLRLFLTCTGTKAAIESRDEQHLVSILQECKWVRTLMVTDARLLYSPRIRSAMRRLSDIRTLKLGGAGAVSCRDKFLSNLRSWRIEEMFISYVDLVFEQAKRQEPNYVLRKCAHSLQRLTFENAVFYSLSTSTRVYPHVSTLEIRNCRVDDIAPLMMAFPNLRRLIIDGLYGSRIVLPGRDRVIPWKRLDYVEGSINDVRWLGFPCPVRHWLVTPPPFVLTRFPRDLEAFLLAMKDIRPEKLSLNLTACTEDDLERLSGTAASDAWLGLTHLSLRLPVGYRTIHEAEIYLEMVIGLARRCKLAFLELRFKCYLHLNVPDDDEPFDVEYLDHEAHKELHFCLDRWDHKAIASRFFYFVSSLKFVGLSFRIDPQFSYWTVKRGAEGNIAIPVPADEAVEMKRNEDMLARNSTRTTSMSLTEEWSGQHV